MVFTFLILSIMISFVGLPKPCAALITIKKILDFPIYNSFPLVFLEYFSVAFYLFFIMIQSRIFFYALPNASVSLYMSTTHLYIYYPYTLPQLYQSTLILCHWENKNKSSEICQFQFWNSFYIDIDRNNLKGSKNLFYLWSGLLYYYIDRQTYINILHL